MALANVTLNNTFDEWRTRTNQIIVAVDQLGTVLYLGYDHANAAHLTANAGYVQANTARVHANAAHLTANAGFVQANTARDHANTSYNQANTAYAQANAAFDAANNAVTDYSPAFITANIAFSQANAAFDAANVANSIAANAGGGFYRGNNGDVGPTANKQDIFRINTANVTANMTFVNLENASATGPLYLDDNVELIVQEGARVVIL